MNIKLFLIHLIIGHEYRVKEQRTAKHHHPNLGIVPGDIGVVWKCKCGKEKFDIFRGADVQ